MEGMASQVSLDTQNNVTEEMIRRLWTAVLVNEVEDWRGGTPRAQRETREFLCRSGADFEMVGAGRGSGRQRFSRAFAEDQPRHRNGRAAVAVKSRLGGSCRAGYHPRNLLASHPFLWRRISSPLHRAGNG